MAKKVGYQVTAIKPVCVDFPDGRVVSFRPGMRFEAHPTNTSVRRLLKVREVRQLSNYERVPVLPVKLGAPHDVRAIMETRKKMAHARNLAEQKRAREKATAPTAKKPVDLGSLNKPNTKKPNTPDDQQG